MSLTDANAILRSCTGDFCRIEVTPASAMTGLNVIVEPTSNRSMRRRTNLNQTNYLHSIVLATLNNNSPPTFYRSMLPTAGWSMRNNYPNLGRKSFVKARHNSISE